MSRRCVFLDRDGTLVHERHYLRHPDDLELYEGVADALASLQAAGYALVVLSNQSGVARGLFGLEEVEAVHAELRRLLLREGIELDGIYFCPHHPEGSVPEFTRTCDCRKPAPGMALRAARDLDLKLEGSWIVGDKLDDLNLAQTLPLRVVLVRTGHGQESEALLDDSSKDLVCDDLAEAAARILGEEAP